MSQPPLRPPLQRRPKAYPAPEFPPRKPKLFAKTPPALFSVLLGLLGMVCIGQWWRARQRAQT